MPNNRIIKFDDNYGRMTVPSHTQESLENYLIHGYRPGGFLTSLLANDLFGAAGRADHVNFESLGSITMWIINNAPPASWGDYDRVEAWVKDINGRRTAYADPMMKQHMWAILKEKETKGLQYE